MSALSPLVVNAVKKLIVDAAPLDPEPDAVQSALLPFAPSGDTIDDDWIKHQYFAVLRQIALFGNPQGTKDNELIDRAKECLMEMNNLCGDDATFPTTNEDNNIEICRKLYTIGTRLCCMAERSLGITYLHQLKHVIAAEKTKVQNAFSQRKPVDLFGNNNVNKASSDVAKPKTESPPPPASLPTSDVGPSSSETNNENANLGKNYNDKFIMGMTPNENSTFTVEYNAVTKTPLLIVRVGTNLAYEYRNTKILNAYACKKCDARAHIANGVVVHTVQHTCAPIACASKSALNPSDIVQLLDVFTPGVQPPPLKRQRLCIPERPYVNQYSTFFFGLAEGDVLRIYVSCSDDETVYEYLFLEHNLWYCIGCKRRGTSCTIKFVDGQLFGQKHHPRCVPLSFHVVTKVQIQLQQAINLTYDNIQEIGQKRYVMPTITF